MAPAASHPVLERLADGHRDGVVASEVNGDQLCLILDPDRAPGVALALRDDPALAFNLPVDCTAVDFLGQGRPYRFEVVWHIYAMAHGSRLRLKVCLGAHEPTCASLTPVWPGMNWHEREAWDLYGIRFGGHPNLKRVLMYEAFVGHPLRKDYPIDKRQPLVAMREVRQVPTQRHPPPELLNAP